jgi:proteasome lid subunit RPN8/RPN11
MKISLSPMVFQQIHANGENAYPEEGAGLLLGVDDGQRREVRILLEIPNSREDEARHNRYLITPEDMLQGEVKAMALGLDIVGVFHSHPDHPNRPSQFDRDWALPWYSYIITSVSAGKAVESRSWRLADDRANFTEEDIEILNH